jgi:hypothetical protein
MFYASYYSLCFYRFWMDIATSDENGERNISFCIWLWMWFFLFHTMQDTQKQCNVGLVCNGHCWSSFSVFCCVCVIRCVFVCCHCCAVCGPGEFTCVDGTCIDFRRKCDKHADCQDFSDETDCDNIGETCNYLFVLEMYRLLHSSIVLFDWELVADWFLCTRWSCRLF